MNRSSLAAVNNRPLASLTRTGLEKLFHCWIGASGRRYICSIYAFSGDPLAEPPAFDCRRAVVAAVRRDQAGPVVLFVFQPRDADDFRRRTQRARARGASEWHVHLLAETPEARAFAVIDLSPSRRLRS